MSEFRLAIWNKSGNEVWWVNFAHALPSYEHKDRDTWFLERDKRLQEWNARIEDGDIVFDDERDAMLFLLRWA